MNAPQRRLAAIMFTDIVGYSALTQRNEALALELLNTHFKLLRPVILKYNGHEIKTIGDAFMVEFSSSLQAVQCAIEMQQTLYARNLTVEEQEQIHIRIGIHLGDIEVRENDAFGDGVNIASRIEPLANKGGICISRQVYDQVHNKLDERLTSLGTKHLKNIQVPVEVFKVVESWESFGPTTRQPTFSSTAAKFVAATLAVLLIGMLGWFAYSAFQPPAANSAADTAIPGIQTLAVLPFENLSADEENEYFSDGMTEELLNVLAKIENLKVPARTSSFAFKGKNEDIKAIGAALGVDKIIEGSVRKSGDKIRITVQLINVENGFHLWSETYDRNLEDIFEIQDEIAQAIASELKVKLLGQLNAPTDNVEAYNYYLQGRHFWNLRTEEGFENAINYFNMALEKDPGYALAHVGLADSYNLMASYGYMLPQEGYPLGKAAAEKALALDDRLAEAYTSLAFSIENYDNNYDAAVDAYEEALELNPNYATAHHWYALLLRDLGRSEESIRQIERALELDPLSLIINMAAGALYEGTGNTDQAVEHYEKALELNPMFINARAQLATLKHVAGDFEGAEKDLKLNIEHHPEDDRVYENYGQFLRFTGRPQEALAQFEKAASLNPNSLSALSGMASIYEMLGDWDKAGELFKHRMMLAPDDANGYFEYASHLLAVNRAPEAINLLNRLFERFPNHPAQPLSQGSILVYAGQFDEAITSLNEALDKKILLKLAYTELAKAYLGKSLYESALQALDKAEAIKENDSNTSFGVATKAVRGRVFAAMGNSEEAEAIIESILNAPPVWGSSRQWFAAQIYAALDNADKAFEHLNNAYDQIGENMVNLRIIQVSPAFRHLQDDPRFDELLQKMGLMAPPTQS